MARHRRGDRPAPLLPLDVDGVRTVAVGTVLWAVAFLVLLPSRDALREQGRGLWMWTCLAGFGLGLLGVQYCRRRRDALVPPAPAPSTPPGGPSHA